MTKYKDPLKHAKVASPCSVDWESMIGDARRRFCGQCELNVYNLSEMSRREAEDLINRTEGRLCVRFYRRADGTVLTKDCPIGLRAMRRKLSRLATATLSAIIGFFSGLGLNLAITETAQQIYEPGVTGMLVTSAPIIENLPPAIHEPAIMGDIVTPEDERSMPVAGEYIYYPEQKATKPNSKRGRRAKR
jgi:hypothetical protein